MENSFWKIERTIFRFYECWNEYLRRFWKIETKIILVGLNWSIWNSLKAAFANGETGSLVSMTNSVKRRGVGQKMILLSGPWINLLSTSMREINFWIMHSEFTRSDNSVKIISRIYVHYVRCVSKVGKLDPRNVSFVLLIVNANEPNFWLYP